MDSKERDQAYAALSEQLQGEIDTWDDLYSYFDRGMQRVAQTMSPLAVFDTLLVMYSFFDAMREMPEEGDVKVLLDRAIRTLIYEGKDKLGMEVCVLSGSSEERYRRLLELVNKAGKENEEVPEEKPRTLH